MSTSRLSLSLSGCTSLFLWLSVAFSNRTRWRSHTRACLRILRRLNNAASLVRPASCAGVNKENKHGTGARSQDQMRCCGGGLLLFSRSGLVLKHEEDGETYLCFSFRLSCFCWRRSLSASFPRQRHRVGELFCRRIDHRGGSGQRAGARSTHSVSNPVEVVLFASDIIE